MRLLLDIGNTQAKWILGAPAAPLGRGKSPTQEIRDLLTKVPGRPQVIIASNVAGGAVQGAVEAYAQQVGARLHWVQAQDRQAGVSNAYLEPATLGSDRWAALIGAWHLVGTAALVVNCGTATTIDALSAAGRFMGGLILPGLHLMQQSLLASTAGLKQSDGQYQTWPRRTADGLKTGAIQATLGAVERQRRQLGEDIVCLLTGGAVAEIAPHLPQNSRIEADLVFVGMDIIANEGGKQAC